MTKLWTLPSSDRSRAAEIFTTALGTVSDKTDYALRIGEHLREGGTLPGRPTDPTALIDLLYAYRQRMGTPDAERFSRGIAACLTDPSPAVRAQALMFFEANPDAAGGEALVKLFRSRRFLFAGVPNPFASSSDLEWQLLRAIGARLLRRDAEALAIGYAAVLEPGLAQPLIAALTLTDPEWVVEHAEAIVAANPEAGRTLLNNLQRSGHDVGAVGERIAPLAARDPRFREGLELLIHNGSARRRIFAALPS